jgi:hypothetical protein
MLILWFVLRLGSRVFYDCANFFYYFLLNICKLFIIRHLRLRGPARLRKSLIFNALLIGPTAKKLCPAHESFLDTHGERRLASCLANAPFDRARERACVDCHNDFTHVS